jgi:hypothetical protein
MMTAAIDRTEQTTIMTNHFFPPPSASEVA